MVPRMGRWITPLAKEPIWRIRESVFYRVAFSAMGVSLLWVLASAVALVTVGSYRQYWGDLAAGIEGVFLSALAYFLARRGLTRTAFYTILFTLLVIPMSSMLLIWQNVIDPTMVFFALAVAGGGLLLGRQGAILFYLASMEVYLATSIWLFINHPPSLSITKVGTLVMTCTMLGICLGMVLQVIHYYIHSVEHALEQAEEQVRERTNQLEAAYRDLAQQHGQLNVILRNVADSLVVTDRQDRIVRVNPAFAAVVGLPDGSLVGQPIDQVLGKETLPQIIAAREKPGTIFSANLPWRNRVYQLAACAIIGRENETVSLEGVVTVLHDITAQIEEINVHNRFVSTVAHELRLPLNSIKGFADLLLAEESGTVSEEQRFRLSIIQRNTEQMAGLVRDLLELCRLESGRAQMEIGPTSLRSAVEDVAILMQPQLREKGLNLELALPGSLPLVLADAHRLNQVLMNLLSNACKYTPPLGKIRVEAGVVAAPQSEARYFPVAGKSYVWLSVRDTGIGIAPEDQERIFEWFVRLEQPAGLESSGTGLGLTISRQLLQLQGGRIWVESTPGQGSTFSFSLPMAEQL